MDVQVTDNAEPFLAEIQSKVEAILADVSLLATSQIGADLRKRLPVQKKVSLSDLLPGKNQPRQVVGASFQGQEGIVRIAWFYATAGKIGITKPRQGLWVNKLARMTPGARGRAGSPTNYVGFGTSTRLEQWAEARNQLVHKAIWLDDPVTIGELFGESRERVAQAIQYQLTLKLSQITNQEATRR